MLLIMKILKSLKLIINLFILLYLKKKKKMFKKRINFWIRTLKLYFTKIKILITLIRVDDNICFHIFKYIINEYIPFDILMSYSSNKKNIEKN